MKLTIAKEVQEKITGLSQAGDRLVLDFEDGIGPFVEAGASCQFYPNFRLLFVPKEFPEAELAVYDDQLATELGPVYLKKSSEMLLDEDTQITIERAYQRVQLTAKSGILAANLPLKRIELDEEGCWNGQAGRRYGSSC